MLERVSDETLMAFADGMLEPAEQVRLAALIGADPTLAKRVEPFVLTRTALPEIFSEALTSPVPDRLVGTVLTAPIGTRRDRREHGHQSGMTGMLAKVRDVLFPAVPSFSGALALAACVATIAGAGWIAGRLGSAPGPQTAIAAAPGVLLHAGDALAAALESTPSNAAYEQGIVRVTPVSTFRDKAGRFCRQYTIVRAGEGTDAGFACRSSSGSWSITAHMPAGTARETAGSEAYVPAGAETQAPALLEQTIDAAISGDVLTAAQERRLLSGRWDASAE